MKHQFFKIVTCFCLLAQVAQAHKNEQEFRDRVHAYLMDHPEVILEALERLSAQNAEAIWAKKIENYSPLFEREAVLGIGELDAPVRVVEFFDYKCEPCKAVHPELKAFVAQHPQVRIEMRQLPILSPGSERAARFALSVQKIAGDAAYSAAHDLLWSHKGPYNPVVFFQFAQTLALDFQVIENTMEDESISQQINENRDMAIDFEIYGTPAFVTRKSVSFGQANLAQKADSWLNR